MDVTTRRSCRMCSIVRVARTSAVDRGVGGDGVDSSVGDIEPVALTDLSVGSPALLSRCDHVSAELTQPIRRQRFCAAVGSCPLSKRGAKTMNAVATEGLTAEQMVKIAREQVDAFNNSDWERLQAGLTADASYHEFATQRKVEGPTKIVELFKSWKTAFPDATGTVTSAVSSGGIAV